MEPASQRGEGGTFWVETPRQLKSVRLQERDPKAHRLGVPTPESECPPSSLTLQCPPFKSLGGSRKHSTCMVECWAPHKLEIPSLSPDTDLLVSPFLCLPPCPDFHRKPERREAFCAQG